MGNDGYRKKHILITGATGFIGAALAERLLKEGVCASVTGIDDLNDYYDPALKAYRLSRLEECARESPCGWKFIKGDIADKEFLEGVFRKAPFGIVVHLAAQAGVRYSITDPDAYVRSNLVGFCNILEACRHGLSGGLEHLVYASSSSVYGENPGQPFRVEDRTDAPVSLYAATKKAGEVLAYSYAKLYGLPATGLRFFTVYGPAGRPDMAYFSFAEKLRRGEPIRLFNYGDCKRDFTYIDDVVEGIVRVMGRRPGQGGDVSAPPYKLYNIGHGHPEGLMDFVNVLCEELIGAGVLAPGFEPKLELTPMQPGDVPVTYADISAMERDLAYRAETDLRTGLRRFAEWYRDHLEE